MSKICIKILFCFCVFASNAIGKTNPTYTNGKIVKGTVDGCTWLIKLDEEKYLQPINLNAFIKKPRNGQKVKFVYNVAKGKAGFCMMGQMVELVAIKKRCGIF
jgi:hypothetical protein